MLRLSNFGDGDLVGASQPSARADRLSLQAFEGLQGVAIGKREVRVNYMRLYPNDVLLQARLGSRVWEMYLCPEADMSSCRSARPTGY